jgi:F-type H+-transporting ATPase subunit alpha
MKKVAGTLRLDLAAYREMAAFAQFASDLDASTQRQLARGERLVELLKQGQYAPMPFEQQVLVIFAATKGFMDEVPVDKVSDYEKGIIDFFESEKKDVMEELRASGKLDDSVVSGFESGIQTFNERFLG